MFGTEVAGGAQSKTSHIFRFDNYCIQLIISDDYMQMLVQN